MEKIDDQAMHKLSSDIYDEENIFSYFLEEVTQTISSKYCCIFIQLVELSSYSCKYYLHRTHVENFELDPKKLKLCVQRTTLRPDYKIISFATFCSLNGGGKKTLVNTPTAW